MARHDWMDKVDNSSICTWYYAFFIINAIIASLAFVGLVLGLFMGSGPFFARFLNMTGSMVALAIAVVNALFFYLMCDRTLMAQDTKASLNPRLQ